MEICFICLAFLIIVIGSFIPEDNDDKIGIFFTNIVCSIILAASIYSIAYNKGVKDGAYDQLRHKYGITYVIDEDSCVVDTIINLK